MSSTGQMIDDVRLSVEAESHPLPGHAGGVMPTVEEMVESVKRLSPEQLAKVKQQIAMAKAGLAASSLGAGLGMHSGSEPKAQKRLLRGTPKMRMAATEPLA